MVNPDQKPFSVLLENPQLLFRKAKYYFDNPEDGDSEGLASTSLGYIILPDGLFSEIETILTLYRPFRSMSTNNFMLFTLAKYREQVFAYWSNPEMSRLQASLRKSTALEIATSSGGKSKTSHLFIFNRPHSLRLHANLGYMSDPHFHPQVTLSAHINLDADPTCIANGTPIPFDEEENFVFALKTGNMLLETVINSMFSIKKVTASPQTLVMTAPNRFEPISM